MPLARRVLALAAAVLLVAAGAGIGLPHLARVGLTPVTVVGLAALLVGLGLGIAASVRLVGATPPWWRLAVVPGLVVVVLVGLDLLVPPLAATVVARAPLGSLEPRLAGLGAVEVTISAADDVVLAGSFVASRTGAAVVLLHGAGSSRAAVQAHAIELADHGYGVLLLDARGHGRSTGRAMDWGWFGDADIRGAVTFLAGRPGVDPARIAAVGLSMGGEEAIGAAADSRLRAVVAEGATGRSARDLGWLSDVYGWRGHVQEGVEAVHTGLADVLSAATPPTSLRAAVAAAPCPVLLVVAGEVPDETFAARSIHAAAPANVEVWSVPGAPHTGALATDPTGWRTHVLTFLDAATA